MRVQTQVVQPIGYTAQAETAGVLITDKQYAVLMPQFMGVWGGGWGMINNLSHLHPPH